MLSKPPLFSRLNLTNAKPNGNSVAAVLPAHIQPGPITDTTDRTVLHLRLNPKV